jgi:hypothetical protein
MVLLSALLSSLGVAGASAPAREPNYFIFTLMGQEALGRESNDFASMPKLVMPDVAYDWVVNKSIAEIKKQFGEQHAGQPRYVGFSLSLTPILNLKPEKIKAQVNHALDLAERNNLPVLFHTDDQHEWWQNPQLSKNPQMVEWSDFPAPGKTQGTMVPDHWLHWADPPTVYPAGPPCFACPAFREVLAKRLRECVAEPIVQRVKIWRGQGKEFLFAGIVAGNETSVPDFSFGFDGYEGDPAAATGLDKTKNPPVTVRMSRQDLVPIGYHSLYAMGYTRESLERLAAEQHKSLSEIVKTLLFQVAHDYAEFQDKTLYQAGVPRERIYTHFTSTNYTLGNYQKHVREMELRQNPTGLPGSDNLSPPVTSAVNRYSRPGFTVVRNAVDLKELVAQLRRAGAPDEGMSWAVVESYPTTMQPGRPQTEAEYAEYLGALVANGAKVVSCYGWNMDGSTYAVKGSGVIPAVSKWLAGQSLPKSWSRSADASQGERIQSKMMKLQQEARKLIESGHDPHPVKAVLDSFESEFQTLVHAGRMADAEAALDRAIARLQAMP